MLVSLLHIDERTLEVGKIAGIQDLHARIVLALNGVSVSGQLFFDASASELNHTPK
jgi:hypothetical protein